MRLRLAALLLALAAAAALAPAASGQAVTFPGLADGAAYAGTAQTEGAQTLHLSVAGQTQDLTMTTATALWHRVSVARDGAGWRLTDVVERTAARSASPMTEPMAFDTAHPEGLPADERDVLLAAIGQEATHRLTATFRAADTSGAAPHLAALVVLHGTHAPGSAWTDSVRVTALGLPLGARATYTLRDVRGDTAYVSYTVPLRGEGRLFAPGVPEGVETRVSVSGTGEGWVRVHLGDGGMRTEGTTALQGVMEMRGEGLEAPMAVGVGAEQRTLQTLVRMR